MLMSNIGQYPKSTNLIFCREDSVLALFLGELERQNDTTDYIYKQKKSLHNFLYDTKKKGERRTGAPSCSSRICMTLIMHCMKRQLICI